MASRYLVAGDIGGTTTLFELFEQRDTGPHGLYERAYRSGSFADFNSVLATFLAEDPVRAATATIDAASFSVAGPVEDGATKFTNLDWRIEARGIAERFAIPEVTLINDFAAVGAAIAALGDQGLVTLQPGAPDPAGARVVVGAGTGLGVSMLTWQNGAYVVHASEGGHTDFAPLNETQDALLASLRKAFGRVSYERVVSGPGLLRIFSFLQASGEALPSKQLMEAMQRQDEAAAVSEFAINKLDPLAVHALDLFVDVYGTFAGNMALTTLARGGVYVAGGIARKIANKLNDGSFLRAFIGRGRFSDLLRRYPLHIVTDYKVGVKGALSIISRGDGLRQ